MENGRWMMKVMENYKEQGAPAVGSILLTEVRNRFAGKGEQFMVADGVKDFDRKHPLKALHTVDYAVVVVYLALMVIIGFIVARRNKSASDYFKGGGHTPWWLAGVSLWMSTFSTVTFVSGVGTAFDRIFAALLMYLANVGGFLLGYFILAARWRRTRALTAMQYLEERYDNKTHSLFSSVDVIIGLFYAAAQLLSLVAITGGALSLSRDDMPTAIVIIGLATLIYTVVGGFWAVVMTDMLQAVVLVPVALVLAVVSLKSIGGLAPVIANAPPEFWKPTSLTFTWPIIAAMAATSVLGMSSGGAAQRYFAVRNESAAKKVAMITAILTFIGPLIWFAPAVAASYLYSTDQMTMVRLVPDFPIRESTYILMCRRMLPTGLIGLVLAAMFAATMSSIDTSFNFRGAIISRDIIKKYLMPRISDKALLVLGQVITGVVGLVAIALCVVMQQYGKSMFDVMFKIGGKVVVPLGVPIVLGLMFKNTKRWTGFACAIVGLLLGVAEFVLSRPSVINALNYDVSKETFMKQEWQTLWIGLLVLAIYFVPGWLSPQKDAAYKSRLDAFWKKMHTPVSKEEELEGAPTGLSSFALTGMLTILIGVLTMMLLLVVQSPLIVWTAGITILFGAFMWIAGKVVGATD